jgi:AcrR family transcriptional regulator
VTRRVRERAPEARASLSAATRTRVVRGPAVEEDAPRVGLSRAEALDIVLERAEAEGASPAYARILRGAADVFGRVGVESASVELILEAAGLSRRTFYQFFENKAQVLDALLAIIASIWRTDAARALAAAPRIETLAQVFIRAFRLGGFLLRALFAEALRPHSPLAPRYDAMLDALTKTTLASLAHADARHARTRATIVAMIAIIMDSGIDPESRADTCRDVESRLCALFGSTDT